MPRKKESAVWNGAKKLSNMKPEKSMVDVATWRMIIAGKMFLYVKVLGGVFRTYFHLGFKKKKKPRNLVLKLFRNIRKI